MGKTLPRRRRTACGLNPFKQALKAGRLQIGLWHSLSSHLVVEILADSGFDWILLDTEHAPNELPMVLTQLQATTGSCFGRDREAPRSGRRPCRLAAGRRVDRVEARQARPIHAPPCQHRGGLRRARNRLSVDYRGDGHHHSRRRIAVSRHGSTGAVRAPFERRAQPGRDCRRPQAREASGATGRPHPGDRSATPAR